MRSIYHCAIALLLLGGPCVELAEAQPLTAFSLRAAQRCLETSSVDEPGLASVGGITCMAGLVIDPQANDLILVGQAVPHRPRMTLDDVVVAMRAPLLVKELPLVSIDRTADTATTGVHKVRFAGGIQTTQFGADFLEADIMLKRLAIGVLEARSEGIRSYFDGYLQKALASPTDSNDNILSRFWYITEEPPLLAHDEGVVAIRKVRMRVCTQIMGAVVDDNEVPPEKLAAMRDPLGDEFSASVTDSYWRLAATNPSLARLKVLFEIATLFSGYAQMDGKNKPDLDFWLRRYNVRQVRIDSTFPLLVNRKRQTLGSNKTLTVQVSGGVTIRGIARRLRAGSVTSFRDVVLDSRPSRASLVWEIPVSGWRIPGVEEEAEAMGMPLPSSLTFDEDDRKVGCHTLVGQSAQADPVFRPSPYSLTRMENLAANRFDFTQPVMKNFLGWQGSPGNTNNIGGVMFSNTARVEGIGGQISDAFIDPTTGQPSLFVQGRKMALSDQDLRRFVTALWVVYYGQEDPGISIDPNPNDPDTQCVRLIGNIAGTELAKVMLDADYYMKQCAIGKVRPSIRGFKSVDQLSVRKRTQVEDARRRFWFVPEGMSFSACGNALLFDGGRITVQTEYLNLEGKPAKAEEADLAFAKFWTDHYWDFADANPVYEQLFEYARLTALAKYLKQSNVGLQAFLMANRHLILCDPTPEKVPTLRSPSRYLFGTKWIGGVDLGTDLSGKKQGSMVLPDPVAAVRIKKATADVKPSPPGGNRDASPRATTAVLPDRTFSVVPAAIGSGVLAPGQAVFHTDIQLRAKGEPGVELVRHHEPRQPGLWGVGWDLFRPYSLHPLAGKRIALDNVPVLSANNEVGMATVTVPEKIALANHTTGKNEVLVFNREAFDTVAWVPEDPNGSHIRGLTPMGEVGYVLVEKGNSRFIFDGYGRLTGAVFSKTHANFYRYEGDRITELQDSFGGRVTLQYDSYGRVQRAAEAGGFAADYVYDNRTHELMMVRYSDGRRLALVYDREGKLGEVVCKVPHTTTASRPAGDLQGPVEPPDGAVADSNSRPSQSVQMPLDAMHSLKGEDIGSF